MEELSLEEAVGVSRDGEHAIPSPEPLTNLFLARAKRHPQQIAAYTKESGKWTPFTWSESRQAVLECAAGLLELGAKRGDAIAIISNTRREWSQSDMAILMVGGITVGVYPTLTAEQTRYLIEHSEARIAIVEDSSQRVKVTESCAGLSPPVQIVTLEEKAEGRNVITYAELRRRGAKRLHEHPDEIEKRNAENKSSDVVTYVYTSGTTGEPKGAMLTHANFHYVVHASASIMANEGEISLGFLPLAHSLQRYANYLGLIADVEGYYAESLERVRENIAEVRPTCFATVPRILEKIHAKVIATAHESDGLKAEIFDRSMAALHTVGEARRGGSEPGLRARFKARVADRLVAEKIRARLGGRVRWLGCGGAPLARDVHEFFEDISIPILEGWGLTETAAPVTINTLTNRRIGTVGRPMPGTYVRIDDDGEILVRGPGVFAGYYKDESASRAAFSEDGWFRTGDVGEMSRDGFLRITDRKKDLIITAGGKNIAPQMIEAQLKRDPMVGQAVVIGDNKPYLVALVGIDAEARDHLAEVHGLSKATTVEEIAQVPAVRSALERHIAAVNASLPRFEQVKKWDLLPAEMTIDSGELTPTLKVKRRVVHTRYADRIARMYSES